MNLRYFTLLGSLSALAVGGALLGPARVAAQDTEGVEELTRGPVHEAFAETVSYEAEAGMIVSTAPPAAIEEIPPDSRPEGDNVSWIPGYWAWDDDENDFLWISGIWRNLPPGREWIPGYWNDSQGKYQWTSGYWGEADTEEVTYLPPPPKAIESGPNVAAPDDNHTWIPGSWVYRQERYGWRPGYWEPVQANWIWIPAHYNWTPRGYIFIEGYWDYSVARRGVIFAPVRFRHHVYTRPNYYYTPLTVISLNIFSSHLFIRPSHDHYYFGDYYEPRYRDRGFFVSFSYSSGRRGYDPFYAHSRWEHRHDRDWDRRRRDNFEYYRDNADARPPRTWAALRQRGENDRRGRRDDFDLAEPLSRAAERRDGNGGRQRFVAVSKDSRDEMVVKRKEVTRFRDERKKLESRDGDRSGPRTQATREKIAKSPLVSRKVEDLAKDEAPPRRPKSRDVDSSESAVRAGDDQPGKDKNADKERGKNAGPDAARENKDGPRTGRPAEAGEPSAEPGTRQRGKDEPRPPRQADENKKKNVEPDAARESKDGPRTGRPAEAGEPSAEPGTRQRGKDEPRPPRQAEPEPRKKAQPEPQQRNRQAEPEQKQKAQVKELQGQAEPRQARQAESETRRSAPAKEVNRQPESRPQRQAEPEPKKKAKPEETAPEARMQRRAEPERQAAPTRQAKQEPQRQAQAQPRQKAETAQRRTEPERQAAPVRQAKQEPQRQVQAQPRQKAETVQRRAEPERQAAPVRQAKQEPQRQAAPTRERKKAALTEEEENQRKAAR